MSAQTISSTNSSAKSSDVSSDVSSAVSFAGNHVGQGEVLMRIRNIGKSFGSVVAVDDVSFDVHRGEILGVIGPNGCGKSTLFNCVLGQYVPDRGAVELGGVDVSGWKPVRLAKGGVGRTFQLLQVFGSMSVRDNLLVALQEHRGSMLSRLFSAPEMGMGSEVDVLIERFRLGHLAEEKAARLSYGQQKLLDTAMAFVSRPEVVFLDEPAGGVNLTMLADIEHQIVDRNRTEGTTFVVVEHNMDFIMRISHRIVVVTEGSVLMTGTPQEVLADARVIEAYLGN
jgi:branched-chain amino acid transport system ATP-binding protein